MAEVTMTPYVPPGGGEKEDPMYWLMAPGLVLGILVVVAFECKSKKPAKDSSNNIFQCLTTPFSFPLLWCRLREQREELTQGKEGALQAADQEAGALR